MDLNPIELSDREVYENAFRNLSKPLADQNFEMIYLWKDIINIKWAKINENLCVFADFDGNKVIWGPILGGKNFKETIRQCIKQINPKNPKMCYLPEELAPIYQKVGQVILQSQEYIYETKNIIELKGEKYKTKRNLSNYFKSNYIFEVEDFTQKHQQACLELLENWKTQKKVDIKKSDLFQFNTELKIARQTILDAEKLGLKGIVIKVEGKLCGFTFGTKLNEETSSIIVEKTDHHIKGISEFIFSEFAKRHWNDLKYLNAQEDMGVEYLKSSKMSYHPVNLLKSYTVNLWKP